METMVWVRLFLILINWLLVIPCLLVFGPLGVLIVAAFQKGTYGRNVDLGFGWLSAMIAAFAINSACVHPEEWVTERQNESGGPARASRLTAAEMLSRVQALHQANAQWNTIWTELNPSAELSVQQLLEEIRGPHLFAPGTAMDLIEQACQFVLASSGGNDALSVLREAALRARRSVS